MSSSLPKLYWFNLILTISLIVVLIMEIIPVPVLFIIAFAIALLVNFPDVKKQQEQIASHAAKHGYGMYDHIRGWYFHRNSFRN